MRPEEVKTFNFKTSKPKKKTSTQLTGATFSKHFHMLQPEVIESGGVIFFCLFRDQYNLLIRK